jgi:ATP-dependent exoDNAse (exonuclease V) beta subunit
MTKAEEIEPKTDKKAKPVQEKQEKSTKRHKPVIHELVINEKMADMKEEYNILYVAITRAIRKIKISNANYIETLDFLYFINNNREALINIFQGRDSELMVTIKRKGQKLDANNTGIIYEDSFISKKTLVLFLGKL